MSENIQVPNGWEVKKLGEIAEKVIKKNKNLKINIVLTNSAQLGVIPQDEFFDKSIATKENINNYYILELDDFIYNPRISKFAPAGPISRNKYGIGCVSPLYTVFKIYSNNNINFYEIYFKSNLWNKQAYNIANFGARFDRMNITDKDFFNMPIPVPPLEEQKKIAEILMLWDKAIEQTKELITYKEKQKKGLMQLLLTGQKRLNNFTDEWKTVKLGEIFDYQNGNSNEEYIEDDGKYFLITLNSIDIKGRLKKYHKQINQGQPLLCKNDIIIILSDIAHGFFLGLSTVIEKDNKYILNQRVGLLRPKTKINSYFISYVINLNQGYFKKHGQGSSQLNLSKGDIMNFTMHIPLNIIEQNLIVDILSKADEEIELLNKQLELYIEQKKGLMQNLLTGKARV